MGPAASSKRNSNGSETNTGPRGGVIAIWQARCSVLASVGLLMTPMHHFAHGSANRVGPPRSAR